jgi:WD40 repeat protein
MHTEEKQFLLPLARQGLCKSMSCLQRCHSISETDVCIHSLSLQIVMPSEGSDVTGGGGKPARVEITQRIPHDGEVNRARHMPQRPSIIATKAPAAEVMIFDCSKHGMKPASGAKCQPDKKLVGHDKEGYGLAWSPHTAGKLLSGSDDTHICLWDIEANHSNAMVRTPPSPIQFGALFSPDFMWMRISLVMICRFLRKRPTLGSISCNFGHLQMPIRTSQSRGRPS